MRKHVNILFSLLIIIVTTWMLTTCRKEEIVIVYSKITTVGTSNTTSMATDVEGLIEELTAATHSEYGVCWSTDNDPTVYDKKSLASGTPAIGSFKVTISGLDPSTTYHTRAFVIDNKKYIYGSDVSFTTSAPNLPVVTTSSVKDITSKYAYSGGNVTKEGDKPVVAKGVCYDTVASPTIEKNKTMDGWGAGSFTSALINLIPSKTYYVRAYAVSEFGISYGTEKSFTTHTKVYSFHDDFSDNSNNWDTGTNSGSDFSMTGEQYVGTYHEPGYLWTSYINLPDFKTVSSEDFEINTTISIDAYDGNLIAGTDMGAGFVWNCDETHFRYFGINKHVETVSPVTYSYSYSIGGYDGSYNVWQPYTPFNGNESNKLTIKKGSGHYYFFIN
ncbi:MAG: hypothetical protein NTV31_06115, partial [Bacteroidia bacterium]|nr:hypothetical protein [Bacteroidia bacterium]